MQQNLLRHCSLKFPLAKQFVHNFNYLAFSWRLLTSKWGFSCLSSATSNNELRNGTQHPYLRWYLTLIAAIKLAICPFAVLLTRENLTIVNFCWQCQWSFANHELYFWEHWEEKRFVISVVQTWPTKVVILIASFNPSTIFRALPERELLKLGFSWISDLNRSRKEIHDSGFPLKHCNLISGSLTIDSCRNAINRIGRKNGILIISNRNIVCSQQCFSWRSCFKEFCSNC